MSTLERKRTPIRKRNVQTPEKSKGGKWCCRKLLAFFFSHIGLCALVIGYSILGAFVFRHYEANHGKEKALSVITNLNMTVNRLWSETYKLNVLYKENWTAMATKEIEKFQQLLIQAVKEGYDEKEGSSGQQWSLSRAWMYSIAVISTIGSGNRPRTDKGKIATIGYAIIGIPLMLLFLTNIGHLLAKGFICFYRYCCVCSNDDSSNGHHHNHSHHHLHDHYHVHHIALNDVSPRGHLIHCNSNADPYRTTKCYSACNSNTQREHYGAEAETKMCIDIPDHHTCTDTLNRAHSHHSILKSTADHTQGMVNSNTTPLSGLQQDREEQKVTVPIIFCIWLIIIYMLLGASLFYYWEGWSFVDSSYFCFVTLSTIGFGELIPGDSTGKESSDKKLIVTSAFIIIGMALIAMCFNLVHEQVLLKARKCRRTIGLNEDNFEDEEINTHNISHNMNDDDFDV